jgi:hypothetical protein
MSAQRMFPLVADTQEPLSEDMAAALMLLEVEYARAPNTTLTADEVRAFIRGTPYAHVAEEFEDYFLFWET